MSGYTYLREVILTDDERRMVIRALNTLVCDPRTDVAMANGIVDRLMTALDDPQQAPQLSATHPGGDPQA